MTWFLNPYKLRNKSKIQSIDFLLKHDYCGLSKAQRITILVKEYFKDVEIPVTENDVLTTIFSNHLKELMIVISEMDDMLEINVT